MRTGFVRTICHCIDITAAPLPPKNPLETPEEQRTDSDHSEPPPVSRQAVTHDVIRLCGWVRNAARKQIGTRANRVRVKCCMFRGEVKRSAMHAWMFACFFPVRVDYTGMALRILNSRKQSLRI